MPSSRREKALEGAGLFRADAAHPWGHPPPRLPGVIPRGVLELHREVLASQPADAPEVGDERHGAPQEVQDYELIDISTGLVMLCRLLAISTPK